jgi:hypothetical protein
MNESPDECAPGEDDQPSEEAVERHFVEGLLARGEVAPANQEDPPPGVTHEIVEEREGEPPKVRRRRFSAS